MENIQMTCKWCGENYFHIDGHAPECPHCGNFNFPTVADIIHSTPKKVEKEKLLRANKNIRKTIKERKKL